MKRFIMTVALAGMVFIPFPTCAGTRVITEALVLRAAMQSSPDFQTVLKDTAKEKADAEQAKRLGNPEIELNARRHSSPDGKQRSYELEITQPFKLSQLSGARGMLSRALFERAEVRHQHGILQVFWKTKLLYAQVWQYQQQEKLYADFQARAQDAATMIRKSVEAGQTPVSEGSLFAGDVAKFGSDLERIRSQKAQLVLQLEKATGLNLAGVKLEKPALVTSLGRDVASLESQARKNASLIKLLEADLNAAEHRSHVASADGIGPKIAPRFIYGRRSGANKELGVGVIVSIPLWDRNQAEHQKAEAERLYARRQLETLKTFPLSERLKQILEVIQHLDKRIHMLESEALPNYRRGFEQAQKSFSAGQIDAAVLWQIRERLFETEREALEVTLEAIEARRILSLETGIIPQKIPL